MADLSTPFTRLAEALQSENIKIYIGAETSHSVPFVVPKGVLLSQGRYFKAALSPEYIEGQRGVLRFPDDDRDAWNVLLFHFFHEWVPWSGDSIEDNPVITLTQAYLLGDKYGLTPLQNAIIRAVMEGMGSESFAPYHIRKILELVPRGCPIRHLAIEKVVESVEQLKTFDWGDFQR